MYPTQFLEWWHGGSWRRIGWEGSDPQRAEDLRAHGAALASEKPGHYRIVTASVYADAPPVVLVEWTPFGVEATS
jgi:hypothetical protein